MGFMRTSIIRWGSQSSLRSAIGSTTERHLQLSADRTWDKTPRSRSTGIRIGMAIQSHRQWPQCAPQTPARLHRCSLGRILAKSDTLEKTDAMRPGQEPPKPNEKRPAFPQGVPPVIEGTDWLFCRTPLTGCAPVIGRRHSSEGHHAVDGILSRPDCPANKKALTRRVPWPFS